MVLLWTCEKLHIVNMAVNEAVEISSRVFLPVFSNPMRKEENKRLLAVFSLVVGSRSVR